MQKTKNYNKLNIFLHCLALIRGQAAERTYIAEYTYDENGIKTSVKAEGKTTYFIYEGNTLLGQYTDNDGTIENAMLFLYDENGEIQGVQHNGRMYYYQKDIMGNVYSIRDTLGNGICSYKYEAYGHNFFGYDGNDPFRNINPIKYRGYYYDSYYGGYYNLSRYYNPGMGRFLNLDDPMIALQSKSDPDGMNLYTYCNNDPVNNVDPSGYKYSPSKAYKYAESWWSGTNSSQYKRYKKDCANFVSQCLYAGGLSKMINKGKNAWYYTPDFYYSYCSNPGAFKRVYNKIVLHAKYSSSWTMAQGLYNWLKNNNHVSKIYTIRGKKDVDKVGKILHGKPVCSAALFFDWRYSGDDVGIDHAAISGYIRRKNKYYDIYYYAHTHDRNGKVLLNGKPQDYSFKDLYNSKKYRNMIAYVCILK